MLECLETFSAFRNWYFDYSGKYKKTDTLGEEKRPKITSVGEDGEKKEFFFLNSHTHSIWKEVPRLGVEFELQLLAYTTATAMQDPSHICKLHHNSWQRQILNPLSKVRDRTLVLMETSQVHYR